MPMARPTKARSNSTRSQRSGGRSRAKRATVASSLATWRYRYGIGQLDLRVAEQDRRVGVARHVGVGVVLAVHGHPLPGSDAGHRPDQKPGHNGQPRLHSQRSMGQGPVQIHGGQQVGQLTDGQPDEDSDENSRHPGTLAYLLVGRGDMAGQADRTRAERLQRLAWAVLWRRINRRGRPPGQPETRSWG